MGELFSSLFEYMVGCTPGAPLSACQIRRFLAEDDYSKDVVVGDILDIDRSDKVPVLHHECAAP